MLLLIKSKLTSACNDKMSEKLTKRQRKNTTTPPTTNPPKTKVS